MSQAAPTELVYDESAYWDFDERWQAPVWTQRPGLLDWLFAFYFFGVALLERGGGLAHGLSQSLAQLANLKKRARSPQPAGDGAAGSEPSELR